MKSFIFLFTFIILHKGRSPPFHYQKQAYKKGDLNSNITFERVTDKYTDQQTRVGMRGREAWEGEKQSRDITMHQKNFAVGSCFQPHLVALFLNL